MKNELELLELLFRAKGEKRGLIVREEQGRADLLRTKLYAVRRNNPEVQCISITLDPSDQQHQLFLIRTDTDAKDPDDEALSEPSRG